LLLGLLRVALVLQPLDLLLELHDLKGGDRWEERVYERKRETKRETEKARRGQRF
jgi:hypothetical protein